ncbi:MAG TPA: sugar ABC transporter permease [Streptosporangiales bacterium]
MTLPALLPYAVFAIVPMLWLLRYSFFRWNGFTEPTFIGFANYGRMLHDPVWWASVLHTLEFGAGRLVIEIPLALALAWALYRGVRASLVYRTVYFLPQVLSPAVVGVVFAYFLQQVGGPANGILRAVRLVTAPVDFLGTPLHAMLSLIGVGVWLHFGLNTLLFLAGMSTIPRSTVESAELDGASQPQILRHVVVPQMRPIMRVVVLVYIVGILRSFDLVKTLTNGGPYGSTDIMFTYVYDFFFDPNGIPQVGYASALGVSASLVVAAVSLLYMLLSRRPGK